MKTGREKRRIWITVLVVLFALATAAKLALNELNRSLYHAYNSPQSESVADARKRGILLDELRIAPRELSSHDRTYEIEEAWLEIAYEPRTFLVWIDYSSRTDWAYLCIRPKTHWHHDSYSYWLDPEFREPFTIEGSGRYREGMALRGDLFFQRVPADLDEVRVKVRVDTNGKRDFDMGTMLLSRPRPASDAAR
ncbi:MAG: hypothetical protein ACYC61_29630 [Isosphaeraceae bacterium]